jgi:hypothetical protein
VSSTSTSRMSVNLLNGIEPQQLQRSNRFWFDDGSVLVSLVPSVYKVHKSVLQVDRHSTKFASWLLDDADIVAVALSRTLDDVKMPVIAIPVDQGIATEDFEMLLAHLYHDS